ncbi:Fe2+-enterobactin ABC transporter substrate-binding protein [Actinorugispora endophytica]|uniref:Iron complex transport system substrate-binding protein n=1 Tax=Actinorugispora endophytica TaxID=1605990 RepID=A0A4R6UMS9_9ACTN|nr:Fe2+-enterobactin ABC transporter substrate-binding protein [Actinorugispora endophytica]TDQ48231.1 iron complex transport system substrate-binding protein [Actinorugispora endophytica]
MKQVISFRAGRAALLTGIASTLLLSGCATGQDVEAASDGDDGTRTVTHVYGETDIPTDPQRVVSVSVTATAPLLSLDAPVVASFTTGRSELTDDKGFFGQWAGTADERGVEALPGPEINVEAVANAAPDVIVGSGFGAAAVDEAVYAQLSEIAPTVVYDSSDSAWQDVTEEMGAALGREDRAAEILQEYDALTEETAKKLDADHDVVILTLAGENFNVFSPVSAQGRFADDLGLTTHEMDGSVARAQEGRSDIAQVSLEDAEEFGDSTLLFVNTRGEEAADYLDEVPVLSSLPAGEEDRIFTLGPESFRIDYYSAPIVADRLVELLGSGS